LTSFFATEKKKKEKKKDRCTSLAAYQYTFWMLMLDDYTIEELSSDEFDNMKRFQEKTNKFRLVLDVTDIRRRKEKNHHIYTIHSKLLFGS